MIIISAREEVQDLVAACHEVIDLSNRLGIGVDLDFKGTLIEARPGMHPYNLVQRYNREQGL